MISKSQIEKSINNGNGIIDLLNQMKLVLDSEFKENEKGKLLEEISTKILLILGESNNTERKKLENLDKNSLEIKEINDDEIDIVFPMLMKFKLSLHEEHIEEFKKYRNELKDETEIKENFLLDIKNENNKFLVLKLNGEIIGFVIGRIKKSNPSIYRGYKYGEIGYFWVDSKYRGNGLSNILRDKIFEFLKENNCNYVQLETLYNGEVKNIYKKWGFLIHSLKMNLKI